MNTLLIILSFPFWFYGIVFFFGGITNNVVVTTNGKKTKNSLAGIIIGAIFLIVAYVMSIGF